MKEQLKIQSTDDDLPFEGYQFVYWDYIDYKWKLLDCITEEDKDGFTCTWIENSTDFIKLPQLSKACYVKTRSELVEGVLYASYLICSLLLMLTVFIEENKFDKVISLFTISTFTIWLCYSSSDYILDKLEERKYKKINYDSKE